jgi:hypothetical protein
VNRDALLARMRELKACGEAVEWLENSPHQTLAEAWIACERADWMLWLLVRTYPHTCGQVRLALCSCAETALQYVPKGEDRPRLAIETARRYARGNATDAELAAARDAAWDAAWDAVGAAVGAAALKEVADIVRRLIPDPENLPRLEDMP